VEELNRHFLSQYPLDAVAPRSHEMGASSPTASASPDGPLFFTGIGQQASELFHLTSGLAVFKLSHDGAGHFGVWLLDNAGNKVELLANSARGPFSGSKPVQIVATGSYLLDISADGAWNISVVGTGPVRAVSTAELPRFEGSAVVYSRSERTYGIYNTGADIYDLSVQPIANITMFLSRSKSFGHGQLLDLTVKDSGGLPPALTVALRYTTASGRISVQLFELAKDGSSAKPIP
jgi:hypothetical protein